MKRTLTRFFLGSFLIGAAALAGGCVLAPVVPPRGLIYTNQTAPLFPGGEKGTKSGEASAHNIAFIAGWGDAGLDAAMDDAGISEVTHTDYRVQNYLLIYQRYTTIVYGK